MALLTQTPYKARTFDLSGLTGISDNTLEVHFGLYGGYVKNVNLLNEQLKKILTAPGEAKLWQDRGLDVIASSPEEFAARLAIEQKKWGDVIKKRGLKPE